MTDFTHITTTKRIASDHYSVEHKRTGRTISIIKKADKWIVNDAVGSDYWTLEQAESRAAECLASVSGDSNVYEINLEGMTYHYEKGNWFDATGSNNSIRILVANFTVRTLLNRIMALETEGSAR